jgi:AcrR family transcriptional regulator
MVMVFSLSDDMLGGTIFSDQKCSMKVDSRPGYRACQVLIEQLCLLNMKKRKYTKSRRAEQQDETRERIVEATVKLHEKLGPAKTSIKAIAEEAGVQRLTVYRHFPDDASLFEACTTHYLGLHPPPNLAKWSHFDSASERSHTAFLALFSYYRQTEKMWTAAYRDVEQLKALQGPMGQFETYLDQVRDDLLASWNIKPEYKKSLAITLRHCLRFSTWSSLKHENLSDKTIAELIMGWVNSHP